MQPSSDQPTGADRSRQLRRYGPLLIIAVIAVVAILAAVLAGGGDDDEKTATGGSSTTAVGGKTKGPEGAISWQEAQDENLDVTFPDSCDKKTGKAKLPYFLVQPCYADVKDNGGETSKGVTADAVKVVVYVAPDSDPALDYITAAIKNEDTVQDIKDTYQGYADMFNDRYQTYGRKIELQFLDGSGTSQDEVAARADAVKAADEMGAFAVWGGPVLTSAFADELAARKVVCIGCTGGDPEFFEKRAPYLYSAGANADQVGIQVVEYIKKKLDGKKAEFAGDALKGKERKFGYLWIDSNDSSADQAATMEDRLSDEGVELSESISYTLDPARLQEQATSVIAKFKAAGVTTVLFSGDPVAPANFTKEATAQDYFPEWVLGPQTLVDVTAFARTYDQEQWAHAFGPSPLTARFKSQDGAAYFLYKWFNGEAPPAKDTAAVQFPNPALFFAGIQAAGPDLTPETFRDGLFSREPTPNAITQPSLSFGDHGLWPYDDYNGTDDMTEVWWDPKATGPDEIRKEGTGMYRYVDGGKRYFPGDWTSDVKLFDPKGSVTILDGPPDAEKVTDYPSP
ncbi:hypothetical protein BH10ACT1_BH10ACT1_05820 [soil metagenome]